MLTGTANQLWGNEALMNYLKTGVFNYKFPFGKVQYEDPDGKPGCDFFGINHYARYCTPRRIGAGMLFTVCLQILHACCVIIDKACHGSSIADSMHQFLTDQTNLSGQVAYNKFLSFIKACCMHCIYINPVIYRKSKHARCTGNSLTHTVSRAACIFQQNIAILCRGVLDWKFAPTSKFNKVLLADMGYPIDPHSLYKAIGWASQLEIPMYVMENGAPFDKDDTRRTEWINSALEQVVTSERLGSYVVCS